jgi:RNA polymerase sigma-70 factor (ECF subfamily)
LITESELVAVYRQTIQPLYAYVFHRTGGQRELAEDTVQEAFMRAVSNWQERGLPDVPLAWLKTVARNLLVSHFRKLRPEHLTGSLPDLEDEDWSPEQSNGLLMLSCGMARLKKNHALLLEAFYLDEKSVREIAQDFGLSERAVEGRLRRARLKLRRQLDTLTADRGEDK